MIEDRVVLASLGKRRISVSVEEFNSMSPEEQEEKKAIALKCLEFEATDPFRKGWDKNF